MSEKELSKITRAEWIKYRWQEVEPTFGDDTDERMFMQAGCRTPDEAMQAMEDWDLTAVERGKAEGE